MGKRSRGKHKSSQNSYSGKRLSLSGIEKLTSGSLQCELKKRTRSKMRRAANRRNIPVLEALIASNAARGVTLAVKEVSRSTRCLEAFEREVGVRNRQILFHGTSVSNSEQICKSRLRCSNGGMLGSGVYLTPSIDKAWVYSAYGGSKAWMYSACGDRAVVQVVASLGHVLKVEDLHKYSQAEAMDRGYHSAFAAGRTTGVWGGRLRHAEYCVFNPAAIVVERLLYFQHASKKLLVECSSCLSTFQGYEATEILSQPRTLRYCSNCHGIRLRILKG